MTITDQRSTTAAPPSPPPSYVRRHPILTGFGVLSGLSLFSALWPLSAIVVAIAVGGHATGLDRAAWRITRTVAARVVASVRSHEFGEATGAGPAAAFRAGGPFRATPRRSAGAVTRGTSTHGDHPACAPPAAHAAASGGPSPPLSPAANPRGPGGVGDRRPRACAVRSRERLKRPREGGRPA